MIKRVLALLIIGISLLFAWQLLVFHSMYQPKFVDELLSTQSALKFFTDGNYTFSFSRIYNRWFAPGNSIGLLSSWASVIGWTTGGTLLYARIASSIYCFILFTGAGVFALRTRWSFSYLESLAIVAVAWLAVFRVVPYSFESVIYTLGEFSGATFLLMGMLVIRSRPRLGATILGLCVWHTKFIYLPFALSIIGAHVLEKNCELKRVTKSSIVLLLWFVVPQLFWFLLILIQTGPEGIVNWISYRYGFVVHLGNAGLDSAPAITGLRARLSAETLEWMHYIPGRKARILLLVFVPISLLAIDLVRSRRQLLKALFCGLLCIFSAWYFLWHPQMFIRHFEPALLVGFGVICYYFVEWDLARSKRHLLPSLGLVAALLIYSPIRKNPEEMIFFGASLPKENYSRTCQTERPWAEGPREVLSCDRVSLVECKEYNPDAEPCASTPWTPWWKKFINT